MRHRARHVSLPVRIALLLLSPALVAHAQEQPASVTPTVELATVTVVGLAPLPGLEVPRDQIPANVQTATGADLDRIPALDLASYLNRALGSVTINETQGNPFQPDVNYRGFTASPLLGTPQGLSVYADGVRLNQPFGDVVSWDLIPRSALASVTLMPGSNPLFGLNTLGGALSLQTKDGLHHPGTSVQVLGGVHGRASAEFETGGSNKTSGINWFVTGNQFHDNGWRASSPSDLSQLFAKVGHSTRDGDVSLTAALADTRLAGNGAQEWEALQRDWRSVRSIPDLTRNQSVFLNLAGTRSLSDTLSVSGNVYYRRIRTSTVNGDLNDNAFSASVYQPNPDERTALAGAGYTGYAASGETAANTPYPKWRCIANVLLNDAPNELCNGLLNRTQTRQQNFGATGQLSAQANTGAVEHRLVLGAGYDASRVRFTQSSQFGYLEADRTVTPVNGPGAFADGSQQSDSAYNARVDLSSRSHTVSVYASDTMAFNPQTHLTLSGRYNRNAVTNVDGLMPGGGPGSLDGAYTFQRLNPALGLTLAATPSLTLYGGVNQGTRAPTAIELGCADPASPCKLPNSFAGDPPLRQVVTTTFEAGVRGKAASDMTWNVGLFRSDNRDDLLFVSDNSSGFGYFRNFGRTRRQGLEMGIDARPLKGWTFGVNLTLLDATYRSTEALRGGGNSSNDAAVAGFPGTDGTIRIRPGDRIPLLPRRLLKLYADWAPTAQWRVGLDMSAASESSLRGNENGQNAPDGVFYTGPGRISGYSVLNLGVDYRPTPGIKLFVQVTNLLDRRYTTGGQLGINGFSANGSYVARALPQDANGNYPISRATLLSPGAPRTAWVGVRYTFRT